MFFSCPLAVKTIIDNYMGVNMKKIVQQLNNYLLMTDDDLKHHSSLIQQELESRQLALTNKTIKDLRLDLIKLSNLKRDE